MVGAGFVLLHSQMEFRFLPLAQRSVILTDSAPNVSPQISCRLSATTLEHILMKEQTNHVANSSIQTGQAVEVILHPQLITYKCFVFIIRGRELSLPFLF